MAPVMLRPDQGTTGGRYNGTGVGVGVVSVEVSRWAATRLGNRQAAGRSIESREPLSLGGGRPRTVPGVYWTVHWTVPVRYHDSTTLYIVQYNH